MWRRAEVLPFWNFIPASRKSSTFRSFPESVHPFFQVPSRTWTRANRSGPSQRRAVFVQKFMDHTPETVNEFAPSCPPAERSHRFTHEQSLYESVTTTAFIAGSTGRPAIAIGDSPTCEGYQSGYGRLQSSRLWESLRGD